MQDQDIDELARRAGYFGVLTSYFDIRGQLQVVGASALQRIVDALGGQGEPVQAATAEPVPEPAFQGDGRRTWLLSFQLYAVRSRRNWGHGDFSDLQRLLELAADVGASGIGLNPLHALFLDRPEQSSPYSPNSRLFLNPLYIDVTAIPEFPGIDAALEQEIAALRATELVEYAGVGRIKVAALRLAHRHFVAAGSAERKRDFDAFKAERGGSLIHYAAFETYRAGADDIWHRWPADWRSPSEDLIQHLRQTHGDEMSFQEFLQWVADRQLAACHATAQRRGLSIGLYIDMAVGVDPAGADAWLDQRSMLTGLAVGAPPDEYNPDGQNWGLTSYSPNGLLAGDFAPMRHMLQAAMRYAGAIRIDHVLGLMRLYVVPHGYGPAEGAYILFPFERLLAVIAAESRDNQCIVIGEDLGTVPDGFGDTLAAWGVWSYLVMLFEREWDGGFRPPQGYMEKALATLNTHDLASFAGWMSGHDLHVKHAIGVNPGETEDERERSRAALRAVTGWGDDAGRFERVAAFLAQTPTRVVQVSIEDVLELIEQVNVPGTIDQHPNWRRRLPVDIEDIASDPRLHAIAAVFALAGRG